jgi:hypothetical protein
LVKRVLRRRVELTSWSYCLAAQNSLIYVPDAMPDEGAYRVFLPNGTSPGLLPLKGSL